MKQLLFIAVLCLVALTLQSCKDGDSPTDASAPATTTVTLGTASNAGTTITLTSTDTLRVGYNTIAIRVADSASGAVQKNVKVTVSPMMHMMSMMHACPIEQPTDSVITGETFSSSMVFIMPGSGMEYWALTVSFVDPVRGKTGSVEIPVTVVNASRLVNFTAPDSTRYFVTMRNTGTPKVGMNQCEFLVHRMQSMMMFPPVTDVTLEMTPDMPSMGHGSPGNVNPGHTSKGHYTGTVNYTMTGVWRITLVVKKNNVAQGTAVFMVTL